MRVLFPIAVFAALAVSGGASAGSADNPVLFGTVGPGFSVRLSADPSSGRVTRIPPGTYTIEVNDLGAEHNFHLTGPGGVDMQTDIEATGTQVWTVSFVEGTYHYECDAHATVMKGDVTVETGAPFPPVSPTPTPTPTPTPAPKPPVALKAVVGPGAKISLTRAGARVRVLKPGPAVIAVMDLSGKDNFHLIGPGVNRLTPKTARVKLSWRVSLRAGLYRYRSDATPTLKGSFTIRA